MRNQEKSIWVVLALVLAVTGVVVPVWPGSPPNTPSRLILDEMQAIAEAIRTYRLKHGDWPYPGRETHRPPPTVCSFLGVYACLFDEGKSMGALREEDAIDPWGMAYQVYRFPTSVSLVSVGPNGVLDTFIEEIKSGRASGDDRVKIIHRP